MYQEAETAYHRSMVPANIGVTGTDTGVGKTVVTVAIIRALVSRGLKVAPMKPVETGVSEDGSEATHTTLNGSSDLDLLMAACGQNLDRKLVRPLSFPEPIAPMVAAASSGKHIDIIPIVDKAYLQLERSNDKVVVEGAGGIYSPITATENFATLASKWGLDVVIVAGNRLGVINHTMLTLRAAEQAGLKVKVVVLNDLHDDSDTDVSKKTNLQTIQQLAYPIPVVSFPYIDANQINEPTNSQLLAEAGSIILKYVL